MILMTGAQWITEVNNKHNLIYYKSSICRESNALNFERKSNN